MSEEANRGLIVPVVIRWDEFYMAGSGTTMDEKRAEAIKIIAQLEE